MESYAETRSSEGINMRMVAALHLDMNNNDHMHTYLITGLPTRMPALKFPFQSVRASLKVYTHTDELDITDMLISRSRRMNEGQGRFTS